MCYSKKNEIYYKINGFLFSDIFKIHEAYLEDLKTVFCEKYVKNKYVKHIDKYVIKRDFKHLNKCLFVSVLKKLCEKYIVDSNYFPYMIDARFFQAGEI